MEMCKFILSVALTLVTTGAGLLDLAFFGVGLSLELLLLSRGLLDFGPGLGLTLGLGLVSGTWNRLVVGGTEPLARMFLSNPPGNFRPNIFTIAFIFSTAVVDR